MVPDIAFDDIRALGKTAVIDLFEQQPIFILLFGLLFSSEIRQIYLLRLVLSSDLFSLNFDFDCLERFLRKRLLDIGADSLLLGNGMAAGLSVRNQVGSSMVKIGDLPGPLSLSYR